MPSMERQSTRPLVVWNVQIGTRHRVVATRTKKAAREALGMSAGEFASYVSETGNPGDCETALAEPGVVFSRSNARHREPLVREEPRS